MPQQIRGLTVIGQNLDSLQELSILFEEYSATIQINKEDSLKQKELLDKIRENGFSVSHEKDNIYTIQYTYEN